MKYFKFVFLVILMVKTCKERKPKVLHLTKFDNYIKQYELTRRAAYLVKGETKLNFCTELGLSQ